MYEQKLAFFPFGKQDVFCNISINFLRIFNFWRNRMFSFL